MESVGRIASIDGSLVTLHGAHDLKPGDVLEASPVNDDAAWFRSGRLRVVAVRQDGVVVLRDHAWAQIPALCYGPYGDYLYRAPSCDDDVAVAADLLEDLGHIELANRLRTRLALKVSE